MSGPAGPLLPKKPELRRSPQATYIDENGRIVFRPDPYGWDDRLAQALGLGAQVRQRVKPLETADVGP